MTKASRFLAFVVLLLLLSQLVSGAPAQLQMLLTGGRVFITGIVIKLALIFVLFVALLLYPILRISRSLMVAWSIYVAYLVVVTGFLVAFDDIPIFQVLAGFNAYYALILIAPVCSVLVGQVSWKTVWRVLLGVFLVCALVGIAQFVTGHALLYTRSVDGNFRVADYDFFGATRAFSLFQASMDFGAYSALIASIAVALCGRRETRISGLAILGLSAISCAITMTRIAYLEFALSSITSAVLTFGQSTRRTRIYPACYLIAGPLIVFGGRVLSGNASSGVASSASLLIRIEEWSYYFQKLVDSSRLQQLFGQGLVQNAAIGNARFPIDNIFIAVAMHIGYVGLVLLIILLSLMWIFIRERAVQHPNPLSIGTAAFFSTFAVAGIFNLIFATYAVVFMLALLASEGQREPCKMRSAHLPLLG